MMRPPEIEIFIGPSHSEGLQQAIEAWRAQAEYAILESLIDIRFPDPRTTPIQTTEWPKGNLFASGFELRWEKVDAGFRVTLAKEKGFGWPNDEMPKLFLERIALAHRRPETQFIYLWSENDMRLGRKLRYECLDAQRNPNLKNVQLETVLYCDDHGRLLFWRYRSMRWSA